MNKLKNFVECFPHLFVPDINVEGNTINTYLTTYKWKNFLIASAIHEDNKQSNDMFYRYIINHFEQKEDFTQIDIVKFWLQNIIYKNNSNSYSSNIESIVRIIDLLDSSMYENHFQNTNLVFTTNSNLKFDSTNNNHKYIINIDFSSNVFLEIKENQFELNEINISYPRYKQDDLYIPKKFENYSELVKDSNLLFTFHYMSNGDVFILSKYNIDDLNKEINLRKFKSLTLIASRRNNKWTCYDNNRLEKLFYHRFRKKTIGKNLLKIAFELSHQRKGGLIIYDVDNLIISKILNEDYSVINSHKVNFMKNLEDIINVTKTGLSINSNNFEKLKVLMMMDGCVIFNNKGLVSTGSILSLDKIKNIYDDVTGARSAASIFAHELNGRVLKISQNGTISLFTEFDKMKIILEFL